MKSDIEIARECKLERIEKIAEKVGVKAEDIYPYGHNIGKVPLNYINEEKIKKSNLILVTSISNVVLSIFGKARHQKMFPR